MEDFTILIHGKDCYINTIQECVKGIYKHIIPDELEYDVVVNTEEFELPDSKLRFNYQTGQGLWSERLRKSLIHLKELECNHVMFFLEDMIVKNANKNLIRQVIEFHYQNNNDCTKFGRHHLHRVEETGFNIGPHKILKQTHGDYIISHQPVALFKIDWFLKTLQEDVTPWEHELRINKQILNGDLGDYKVFIVGSNPANYWAEGKDFGEIIEYHHCLNKGQRIPYSGKY